MYSYLTITSGNQRGKSFELIDGADNAVGRGAECQIVLLDPLCSRVHSILSKSGGQWCVRDTSRNGTFVNGHKCDDVPLEDGDTLQVGSTEFAFQHTEMRMTAVEEMDASQTIVHEASIDLHDTSMIALAAVRESEQAKDLLLLYQLTIKLLGSTDANEVVMQALELLRERTQASLVGFLWVDDEGRLKPKFVLPERDMGEVSLSRSLTQLVTQERRAVWIANQQASSPTESISQYADALCVPLSRRGKVMGAVHLYLEQGRFRQSHFDFALSLANITSIALARARHEQLLQTDLERLQQKSGGTDELIGECREMRDLKAKIEKLGPAGGCVLIRGESGSGKEVVARAVQRCSSRADRPLVAVNCAAIPESLMESQLFGHKSGAFTGADRDHAGYFQQADMGSLFLDEVGEMDLGGQAKLLRVLEGHPFQPVGGTEEVSVDVRVIAATNQDLQRYVREKKFREDLYYRLSVFEIYVPPLRDRGDDVNLLADFFLARFREQHGRPQLTLSDAARGVINEYRWPGNVRQLRNVMDSSVVLATSDEIQVSDLSLRDAGDDRLESLRFDFWERKLILEALGRTSNNVPEAAKLLGIGRATLYRKIDEYNIPR